MSELTEAVIRQYASPESFRRGQSYYRRRMVLSVVRRGDQLVAEVEGSQFEPYRVRITLGEGDVASATCSCPYDWGGYCKHIIATLLAYIHDPDRVEERPPLASLLEELGADQLRTILTALVERYPGLVDLVEAQVHLATSPPPLKEGGAPRKRRTPVDPEPFRRQVRYILHSLDHMRPSEAYWHVGGVVDQVRQLLKQARAYVEAGDGQNGLTILEAVTEEYMEHWTYLDDSDGEASGFFDQELGILWAEALLTADLTVEERKRWADKLTAWQEELEDYGIDEAFDVAIGAAVQGWDYPPLVRVLRGEITEKGAWEGEPPWYADDLAVARLNVLERQGRHQEYLYLAEAEGQTERYITMLVRLGRVQEAVEYGERYLGTATEALALARALEERGEMEHALRIAERGLGLYGQKAELARWLRDRVERVDRSELALKAALTAFYETLGLVDYQRVQSLAGEEWPRIREELLDTLRRTSTSGYYPQQHVDIYLYEELIDEAIALVEKNFHAYGLVEQVVDAVQSTHPDWAIRASIRQAERIIEARKAKNYHHAVEWLEKARAIYRATGREREWQTYLEDLIARHRRKYTLVPMLEALR